MEIRDTISAISKRWIMILFIVLAMALLTCFYAYFLLDDEFESTAVMIINSNYADNSDESGTENRILYDQSYNIGLVDSYQVLCQTKRILDQVISETGVNMTTKEMSSVISVSSQKDTAIINITATTADPDMSAAIANSMANIFIKEVPRIMKLNNVQVIDYAQVPILPAGPNRIMIVIIGAFLGLLIGALVANAIEYFDVSIKSVEQLEKLIEVPMIGTVPNLQDDIKKKFITGHTQKTNSKPASAALAKESFGKIRVNLDFLSVDKDHKCIFFTSPISGEGKSTVIANLAISMAASDKKTLLVDADMRNATQHRIFNLINLTGLSDVITRKLNWRDYINETNVPNLHILTAGRIPPNPSELLSSLRMGKMVEEMKHDYDIILFDSPPVLIVPDPISLSRYMDGAILVTRYRHSKVKSISDTFNSLKLSKSLILGCVLNCDTSDTIYKYNYNYTYAEKYDRFIKQMDKIS